MGVVLYWLGVVLYPKSGITDITPQQENTTPVGVVFSKYIGDVTNSVDVDINRLDVIGTKQKQNVSSHLPHRTVLLN